MAEPDAIARCVGDPTHFLREVWTQHPRRYGGADASAWADVLSLATADALIGTGGLRYPALRVVREGKTLPRSRFLTAHRTGGSRVGDAIDPEPVLRAFAEGATLVLQGLHRFHAPDR